MSKKEELLALIKQNDYRGMDVKQLSRMIQMEDSVAFTELMKLLNDLEAARIIARDERHRYFLSEKLGYVSGTLRINPKGFGFVETADDSYYIARERLGFGMDRDVVYARTWTNNDKSVEGEVVEVISHSVTHIVGVVKIKEGSKYFLPDSYLNNRKIKITNYDDFKLVNDSKVLLHIDSYGTVLKCHIEKEIGYKYDPGIDILSILLEKDIVPEFNEKVKAEVAGIKEEVDVNELKNREDLRKLLTITIDGEDARDLDDAITLSKKEDKYYLGVHIADVSHYVKEDSPLDKEALERATSVYLADRVIPMLPKELSNGICSLNAGVERLAMSCMMTFDASGNVLDHTITESVICVDERMSYTGVKAILEGKEHPEGKREDIHDLCFLMKEAAAILKEKRRKRGAIDFDFPESKIVVDEKGYPVDIHPYERNVATDIIEDFMLLANETVAEDYFWQEIPFVYRTHEAPDSDKIKKLDTFIHNFGYYMKTGRESFHPKEIQKLLFSLEGEPEEPLISRLALRSMKQAKYTTLNVGHFGLSTQYYTHFTSPIRRYPDLQIHRIIKENIHGKLNQKRLEHYEAILPSVAQQSSTMERRAQDAEREVDKLKKVEYMQQYIGEVFTGVISGVTSWGFFVELDNTIEGMVPINSLLDDFYVFDEESYKLTGEHTGRIFTLGQKAEIVVRSADKMERTIDFILKEFSQYGEYPDPDDYYGDGMPSRKKENTESEDFEFVDGEYPANQEESEFDETGESLPDKDGILLNDWIDDEEADRLLHLYSKKKIDEI